MTEMNEGAVAVLEPAAVLPAQRQLPWAGITTGSAGESDLVDSAEMIRRAGLDWQVGIRPYKRVLADGTITDSKRMFETYRTDTEDELGAVKKRYEVLQNAEAFDFGDQLVKDGRARWAEAGMQGNGWRVFMTMLLADEFTVLGTEPFKLYNFIAAGHDGTRSLTSMLTPIRVWCTNQTGIVNSNNYGRFTIQHTSSMRDKMAQAAVTMEQMGEYSSLLKAEAEKLAAVQVTDDKARYLLGSVIPATRPKRDDIISGIMTTYQTSPTVSDVYKGTGWGLLNGATEWMDHVRPSRSGNARFESITLGEGFKYRTRLAQALAELN